MTDRVKRAQHHRFAHLPTPDSAADEPFARDPAHYVLLRHPSGRLHPINRNDSAVIRILLDWGWTLEQGLRNAP